MKSTNNHIDQIETLLNQSIRGLHLLFDHKSIKRVLEIPTEDKDYFSSTKLNRIQEIFTKLMECQTYQKKLFFLESLDSESYEMVVRTYFHLVENTLLATRPAKH